MHFDMASLALGFGIACILQTAVDRVLFKIISRVLASALGKKAVIQSLHDALLKLGRREP